MRHPWTKPELMSPAGHWPQLKAAVEAGADAVYFGLTHFSARAKVGFGLAELPEVMQTLHARGVKGFITFNTRVFDHELREAERALAAIAEAGADAIIVQDVGMAQLARRSANRGQCAQACRLSCELMVDGQPRDLGAYRYLLSPGDLYALHQVPELVRIGVACFKIEGRYKDSEYVALTTQAYRQAIDEACAGRALSITPDAELDLEQVYSRGLGPYFLTGTNHQQVVRGRAPRHRGVQVGTIVRVLPDSVHVNTVQAIKRGDGLVFDAVAWRSPDEPEEGGSVYDVQAVRGSVVCLKFGRGDVNFSRIRAGDLVWRSFDPSLSKRLKRWTAATGPVHTRPVSFTVTARVGEPLQLVARTPAGLQATATGTLQLTPAKTHALDETLARAHLGKLGGTPFHLAAMTLESPVPVFVPVSELNALRRTVIEQLRTLRLSKAAHPTYRVIDDALARLVQRQHEFVGFCGDGLGSLSPRVRGKKVQVKINVTTH